MKPAHYSRRTATRLQPGYVLPRMRSDNQPRAGVHADQTCSLLSGQNRRKPGDFNNNNNKTCILLL